MSRIAVYPGSFDPITNGHVDIARRASRLFDRVIVAVTLNSTKRHTFSVNERLGMIRASIKDIPNAEAGSFSGLLVDYMRKKGAHTLIRGLRAVSDMEFEFQMASMNRHLYPEAETVFLMPDERYTYLSSSIIKDVTRMGAEVEAYLPPPVRRTLRRKLKRR
ncbi:MAG: pantetheine-phosphate adenylyltransferase [Elusimicrobiota bacterium]